MINKYELRLGNWVTNGFIPIIVNDIHNTCINSDRDVNDRYRGIKDFSCTFENLHGIPLIPDVLKRCGFIEVQPNQKENDGDIHWQLLDEGLCGIDLTIHWNGLQGANGRPAFFKYLHELQNLYFSLTGREIEFDYPINNSEAE